MKQLSSEGYEFRDLNRSRGKYAQRDKHIAKKNLHPEGERNDDNTHSKSDE